MDHTDALPEDALADILSRLPPRYLAASRCVRKTWLAVVDARRLLCPDVLPLSVHGLVINYVDYEPSHLFARPTALPAIDLGFLPLYRLGIYTIMDHRNGLLLCWGFGTTLTVVNPATRRWEHLTWKDEDANAYLVFDPIVSPHYEVLSIPEKIVLDSPAPQKSDFSTSLESPSIESKGEQDDPHDSMGWPPSLWTLNVFSSSTRQWKMRSFIRKDDVAGTTTNIRVDLLDTRWHQRRGPRWPYSAYWQGSLYIHWDDAFVVRLSLSDCKYQLIKAPIDTEKTKHAQFLGKSENGLYLATIHDRCQLQVWSLTESSGQIDWVLKHDIDLKPLSVVSLDDLQGFDKTWTIAEDDDVHCYCDDDHDHDDDDDDNHDGDDDDDIDDDDDEKKEKNVESNVEEEQEEGEDDKEGVQKENNEMVASGDYEWNSDDDNFLNIEDYDIGYDMITFLGFHPYKEIVFLGLPSFIGVAYHLKTSKIQYLGEMRPKDYDHSPTNGIHKSFPYTPCMIGELLQHPSKGPCGY